jgi:hypothetical protein
MVAMPDRHITIKVDEEALKAQIDAVIEEALKEASLKLRWAADALDTKFYDEQVKAHDEWIKSEVERRLKERE